MINVVKELGIATLFHIDLNNSDQNIDYTPINKCLESNKEPIFKVTIRDFNSKLTTREIPNHEDNQNLTDKNLFLDCCIDKIKIFQRLKEFLTQYSKQYGCWISKSSTNSNSTMEGLNNGALFSDNNETISDVNKTENKVNEWFPFIYENNEGGHILLKITDQTEYYKKNKATIQYIDYDWNSHNSKCSVEENALNGDAFRESPPNPLSPLSPLSPLNLSLNGDAFRESPLNGDAFRESPLNGDAFRESPLNGDAFRESPLNGDAFRESPLSSPLNGDAFRESPLSPPLNGDAFRESPPLNGDAFKGNPPLNGDAFKENPPLNGNASIIFCRAYDIISQQSYWCLSQLII